MMPLYSPQKAACLLRQMTCGYHSKSSFKTAVDKFIPYKLARSRNKLPYVDCKLRRLMRKRDKLHRNKDPRCKDMKHMVQRRFRAGYWWRYVKDVMTPTDDTAESAHESNKRFWSLFKHAKSDSSGRPSLKRGESLVTDADVKASTLNSTFYAAFTTTDTDATLPCDTCSPFTAVPEIYITERGIVNLLEMLNYHKPAGPDTMQPVVLKCLALQLAPILKVIYTRSLMTGGWPQLAQRTKKVSKQLPAKITYMHM